jgi:osmotically-inducible protein OsmY
VQGLGGKSIEDKQHVKGKEIEMNENPKLKETLDELFLEDPHLADYPVEVLNNNGIITLTGKVPTRELSETAEKIAKQTNGVVSVINDIVIDKGTVKATRRQTPTVLSR